VPTTWSDGEGNTRCVEKWGQIFSLELIFKIKDLTVRSNSNESIGLKSRPGSCPYAPVV
jgi:hypothetical protein